MCTVLNVKVSLESRDSRYLVSFIFSQQLLASYKDMIKHSQLAISSKNSVQDSKIFQLITLHENFMRFLHTKKILFIITIAICYIFALTTLNNSNQTFS